MQNTKIAFVAPTIVAATRLVQVLSLGRQVGVQCGLRRLGVSASTN